jgi:hypothetical protein
VELPTGDYYGGHRPGNGLFGESLVAVDLKTGQRKWHYQVVHHPLWNYDMSSAAILADITVNGRAVKAVAVPGKQAFLFVFDRVTGQPVWPIEERPVPQSDIPGEKLSPTQPFVTKPPAYARNMIKVPDDLIDFTPELRAQALERLKRYRYEPSPFTPPILGNVNGPLGAIGAGTATNWPGSAATLPQFAPPFSPGIAIWSRPYAGGVNSPSFRAFTRMVRSRSFSAFSRYGFRSSAVILCRANGGGLVGNGCVGDVFSPGTVDCGTGRSSIGHTGLPFVRSKT